MSEDTQTTNVEQPQVEEVMTATPEIPEEDIFNEIFGDNSSEFAFQSEQPDVPVENKPLEEQQSVDPKRRQ